MDIIKRQEKIVQEKMNECADECAKQFKSSILPIYGSSEKSILEHIGTCILLNLGQENYLLTAAHIVDENKNYSLYLSTGSGLEPINGEFFFTNKPEGNRDFDFYDFAWMKLSKDFLSKLKRVKFISEKDFALDLGNTYGRIFIALGIQTQKIKYITH